MARKKKVEPIVDQEISQAPTVEEAPIEELGSLLNRFMNDEPWFLASKESCPKKKLIEFSKDKNPTIRATVARNPKTNIPTLKKLVNDEDSEVKKEAAKSLLKRHASDTKTLDGKDFFNCAYALTKNNLDALRLLGEFKKGIFNVEKF